jgi:hypothetical protein
MELEQLQERWHQLDQKLERTMTINTALLRQIRLQGTRQRLSRFAVWPVIDLVFAALVLFFSGSFLGNHWPQPTLVIPALGLMIAAVFLVIDNIQQLVCVSRISWDGPIRDIQLALSRLCHARIRQFKWVLFLSPLLWVCLLLVGSKVLFDVNGLESFDPWWLAANIAFGLLFIPAGILIARALEQRWQRTPFWQTVMESVSGHSLGVARKELQHWAEFGDEPLS